MVNAADRENMERRASERLHHRGVCTLQHNGASWSAYVINISESGALIALPEEEHPLVEGSKLKLDLKIEDTDAFFEAEVVHKKEHYLGLKYTPYSDEDSAKLAHVLSLLKLLPD